MKLKQFFIYLILGCSLISVKLKAQPMQELTPMIGAEIFIEPGQTPELIDSWFKIMKDHGMTICRIRMFGTYMHKPDGSWDYTLFDHAYKAAEKYGIKVWATFSLQLISRMWEASNSREVRTICSPFRFTLKIL